jgi:predicted ferric reductase
MLIFFKKNIGWITILALSFLPTVRWFFMLPMNIRFFDFNATTTSLGQIFGLIGMAMFSLNLILSSRLKIFDKFFYGLYNLYNYHRIIGTVSFSLLLFHPLFLAVKYLQISTRSAALFLLPAAGDLPVAYGIVALILMIALIALTFYANMKYQYWKLSHKFMVAVFVFAVLHILFIASDISRDYILRYYILALAALGLMAGFYRAFLSGLFNSYNYEVSKITELNQQTVEIGLAPVGRAMKFQAGQFIFINFLSGRVSREIHPFSIASAPDEPDLKIVVKSLGDYTGSLKSLKVGNPASIEGPFGKFSYKNITGKKQIWIAAGVGITPFLSMARSLKNNDYKIDLYYSTKDRAEAVLIDELENLARVNNNFKVMAWYSSDRGRISGQAIEKLSGGFNDKDILLCGPVPFMENLIKQLRQLKVYKNKIHWEKFNFI